MLQSMTALTSNPNRICVWESTVGDVEDPEMYADIERPESVEVIAQGREGQSLKFTCSGLLARAVQHELDHLRGILFIDRMERKDKDKWRSVLEEMRQETQDGL